MDGLIYLDNNATTRPDDAVVGEMLPFLTQQWGNPSSVHRFGQIARQAIDLARQRIATLISAQPSELAFTGGGTEAINTAVRGLLAARSPRKTIITSTVEHSATRELCTQLERDGLATIRSIGVDLQGRLDMALFEAALGDDPALVTLLWANNETGVLFPAEQIAKLCRERGVPFHCDATQAIGKLAVDVTKLDADVVSFASHKFHGPKGVGAMRIRRGVRLRPLIIGGPQERGRRGGTENVPGIVGMGKAAELAAAHLADMPRVAVQRDRLEATLLQIPDTAINGDRECRLPNTTNIAFARLEAEAVLLLLSEQNLCASAGAACSSGSLEPSHVLQAMGVEFAYAHGSVRFSLSRDTTDAEIEGAIRLVPPVIERLRKVLPR